MTTQRKWWMRLLCTFGVHWSGRSDGGLMGDAVSCDVCGMDRYGPAFIVHDRSAGSTVEVERAPTPEPKPCDHIYFPVPDGMGGYLGQECALCGKFNTLEDVMKGGES